MKHEGRRDVIDDDAGKKLLLCCCFSHHTNLKPGEGATAPNAQSILILIIVGDGENQAIST